MANLAQGDGAKASNPAESFSDAIEKIPVNKVKMVLYSLDPSKKQSVSGSFFDLLKEDFHEYDILGKAEITSLQDKKVLLAAFAKGVRESGGYAATRCFNPRHGLRIINGDEIVDFVICFECGKVNASGFADGAHTGITKSQEPVFDQYLIKYKLKKAN